MGQPTSEILDTLPQKPPFLFVDSIFEKSQDRIETSYLVTGNEDFFKGHFPGNPIMPGVLLQEACFQTGALLMASLSDGNGLGVVSRVQDVKFKNFVKPGDELRLKVELTENMANAFYFKAKIEVLGKIVCALSFTGTLVESK